MPDFLTEVSLYEIFNRPFLKNFSDSDHRIYQLAWSHSRLVLLNKKHFSEMKWFGFLPCPRSILFATKIIVACSSHNVTHWQGKPIVQPARFHLLLKFKKDMVNLVKFYRWILSDWFKIQYFRCRKTCKKFFFENRLLKAYCSTFKNHGSRSQKFFFSKIDSRPKNGQRCFQITLKNSIAV